jgi:hypothetical protein
MKGVEQVWKELGSFYRAARSSGNPSDMRAMKRVMDGFSDELDDAIATGLFKGDDGALPALRQAREMFRQHMEKFGHSSKANDFDKSMRKIVDLDATGADISNLLYGKNAIGEKGGSVHLTQHLKRVLGEDSAEYAAIKQGMWQRLTTKPEGVDDFGPQALSQRIFKFTNGDGADMARAMFTKEEIGKMNRFAATLKTAAPPKGNPSGTAWTLMREAGIGSGLAGLGWYMDNPKTAAALAVLRIGRIAGHGRKASTSFKGGAPTQALPNVTTGAGAGAVGGLAAGQQEY